MKKRSQIADEFKWDLTSYISNENEIEEIFKIIEKLTKIYPTYSGKLANKEILLEALTKYEDDEIKIYKLAHYISHSLNVDSSNTQMLALSQRFDTMYSKLNQANAFSCHKCMN